MRGQAPKGRGALSNPDARYARWAREAHDDGWPSEERPAPATVLFVDAARTVIARNDSPDVPFSQSVNPYRGCEHGCIYCFARPSHAYLGLSPGLDFETRIGHKPDAAQRLREELAAPGYRCSTLVLGANTDCYQPVERRLGITRSLLEVLAECRHPVAVVTKSALVLRDIDLLAALARQGLAEVYLSITTLDPQLARRLEPRAASPARRIEVLRALSSAGIRSGVLFAPLIPGLNDGEMEAVLAAAAEAGAGGADYVTLRLPGELRELFAEWLQAHEPEKAGRVLSLLRQLHEGRLYRPEFGTRGRGGGPVAALYAQRFALARRRLRLDRERAPLDTAAFRPPRRPSAQIELF